MNLLFALPAAAAEPQDYLDSLTEGIPPSLSAAIPDGGEAMAVQDSLGVRHLFEVLAAAVTDTLPGLLSPLLALLALLLLFALYGLVRTSLSGGAAKVGEAVLSACFVLALYDRFFPAFSRAAAYLEDLTALSEVAAPVMGALYLAGGNAASAAASGGVLAGLSVLLDYLGGRALLPLLRVMMGFLLVTSLGEVRTDGIVTSLRNLYVTLLGFFSVLLAAAHSLGGALATASDSFTLRSLRFALGQMVPIVGSAVSGSLGTALASVGLIRSTAGATVAVAVLLPLLPLLAELFLSRLVLSLLTEAAGILSLEGPLRLLRGFRALFDLTLAAVSILGLVFLFVAASFAKTLTSV